MRKSVIKLAIGCVLALGFGMGVTACFKTPCSGVLNTVCKFIPTETGKQVCTALENSPLVKEKCDQYVSGKLDTLELITWLRETLSLKTAQENALKAKAAKAVK